MNKFVLTSLLGALLTAAGFGIFYRTYLTRTTDVVFDQIDVIDADYVFAECLGLSTRMPASREVVLQCSDFFEKYVPRKTKTLLGTSTWPFHFTPELAANAYKNTNVSRAIHKMPPLPPLGVLTNGIVK